MQKYILFLILTISVLLTFFTSCLSTAEQEQTQPAQIEEQVEDTKKSQTVQEMIFSGNTEKAKNSFQIQQNIDATDENGNTVLHAAAKVNDADLVTLFISMGASTELKNNDSDTPLHVAIKNNNLEAAQVLAAVDSDIFARDAKGLTALELGLYNGSSFFPAIITTRTGEMRDNAGRSIIHYFVKAENASAVEYAIQKKIPIDIADNSGATPLSLALENHNSITSVNIAASLLLAGAKAKHGKYAYFEDAVLTRNPTIRFDDGQTPLHLSSIQNHTGITKYLIQRGAVIGAQDISGATPLHESIRYGNVDNARLLLSAGANVNAQDNLGKTPILLIIPQNKQSEIYSLLISHKANINAKDMYGDTVLHVATMNGASTNILQQFLNNGADINERNKEGSTPLALAVEHKLTSVIQFYAQRGADIHAEDKMGNTPLTKALKLGLEMTSKLLNSTNIHTRDSYGNTALHLAIICATPTAITENPDEKNTKDSLTETMEYIVGLSSDINTRNRNGDTALSLAVQRNIKRGGEFLLNRGADIFSTNNDDYSPLRLALEDDTNAKSWLLTSQVIKAVDGSGNTPLHYAAEWGLPNAVYVLVEKGADPNAKNANGETPIYNAVKANNSELIQVLVANGAAKDTRDYLGNTPVHACVRWNTIDATYALVNAGASLDARNIAGKTPLAEAARAGKIDMVNILLENGADINATDETGKTVLIDAIQSGSTDLVRLLLDKGASPLIQEMYGRNAFHEAALLGDPEMISIIRVAGGDPLGRDTDGNTPLSIVLPKGEAAVRATLGTNPNLCDSNGNTPIHVAVISNSKPETLTMLLKMNYPVNRRNSSGTTPLSLAIAQNSIQLASILLQYGADPYIADNTGECAVSIALKENAPVLDQIVKQSGTKTDISGEGILHYAARLSDSETIKRLLSMGLDKSQRSISGESPYDIAVRWQRPEIAQLLQ
ncbi:MAG: ankyrin repeat domain-containing protein [Spirochaetaceae bacterium]|nr:ankyrin repeat domain-containing protein [Spirochaetaceae bacterium]